MTFSSAAYGRSWWRKEKPPTTNRGRPCVAWIENNRWPITYIYCLLSANGRSLLISLFYFLLADGYGTHRLQLAHDSCSFTVHYYSGMCGSVACTPNDNFAASFDCFNLYVNFVIILFLWQSFTHAFFSLPSQCQSYDDEERWVCDLLHFRSAHANRNKESQWKCAENLKSIGFFRWRMCRQLIVCAILQSLFTHSIWTKESVIPSHNLLTGIHLHTARPIKNWKFLEWPEINYYYLMRTTPVSPSRITHADSLDNIDMRCVFSIHVQELKR